MISVALNSKNNVTQIEIQNEINTETKKSTNNSLTSVEYSELLKQENTEACKKNTETFEVVNENAAVANVQECGKLFTSTNVYKMEIGDKNVKRKGHKFKRKKPLFYPTKYWVQAHAKSDDYDDEEGSYDNSFVAKVFLITFGMIIITAIFVGIVLILDDVRNFFLDKTASKPVFVIAMFGVLFLLIVYAHTDWLSISPLNYFLLVFAVICMSLVATFFTVTYNTVLIALALLATAVTLFVCWLLARTSFDFTKYTMYIIGILVVLATLLLLTIMGSFFFGFKTDILDLVFLFVGTPFLIVIIIIELQMILGGGEKEMEESDYVLAALILYLSVVVLFLKLLKILSLFIGGDEFL